jgi:hypothetical protein
MTPLSSYQNLIETIGLSKLDAANKETYNIVKEGSADFTDPELWKEMLVDADIREAYELHVKALEKLAETKPEVKAEMKISKPKKTKPTVARKVKTLRKSEAKKEDPRPTPTPRKAKMKVSKKAVRKSVRKTTTKKVDQKKEVKLPVTVKKLSKELQLIKRMAAMDGKRKTVNAIASLHREVGKTLGSNPDRKPVLNDIQNRLKGALSKVEKAGVKELDIKLDPGFKGRLLENIKNPRPKMKVEYLAGTPEPEVGK